MQNFSIPTLYAIRYYCMQCNRGQKESLSRICTDLLIVHTEHAQTFSSFKDTLPSPLYFFCQGLLFIDVTDALFFGPCSHVTSAYRSVSGPQGCVWVQRCSVRIGSQRAEVIMWVTSQLRLTVRENYRPLLW